MACQAKLLVTPSRRDTDECMARTVVGNQAVPLMQEALVASRPPRAALAMHQRHILILGVRILGNQDASRSANLSKIVTSCLMRSVLRILRDGARLSSKCIHTIHVPCRFVFDLHLRICVTPTAEVDASRCSRTGILHFGAELDKPF